MPDAVTTDWRKTLPVLAGAGFTLRELRLSDAPSLHALLTPEDVSRFISRPPSSVDGFERFIQSTHRERAAGRYVCFGVVPEGSTVAIGLFQVRQLEPGFGTAEWGFALGSKYWGSGLFVSGSRLVVEFAFATIGVHRLEARAVAQNGRGNAALKRVGATREGALRKSFLRDGDYLDQILWTILVDDWREAELPSGARIH